MLYLTTWLLLGSIGSNILWIKRIIRDEANYNGKLHTYVKGAIFGLLLGPFSLLIAILLKVNK